MHNITMEHILKEARQLGASDIHIIAGYPPVYRKANRSVISTHGHALSPEQTERLGFGLLNVSQATEFANNKALETSYRDATGCYRVSLSFDSGHVGMAMRSLPPNPQSIAELKLPPLLEELVADDKGGLILIAGELSQGKSTTMAAMVDHINRNQEKHIIVIQQPVEFVYEKGKSALRQRAVGMDVPSLEKALEQVLREDYDVLAVGEMKGYEMECAVLRATQRGQLVLSTMPAGSIDAIPQIVGDRLRVPLAESLKAVIYQTLVPCTNGGVIAVCEILRSTPGVRGVITGQTHGTLKQELELGARRGMLRREDDARRLFDLKLISAQTLTEFRRK